ncbi:MAG: HAMP domain-containing histidine kinase [Treponema sp.]|nr:HAMP domain-containing histidine kinase [Treponema sp.]
MISLQNRLTLTYSLFISIALLVLTMIVNQFTALIFTGLIKGNIAEKNREIVMIMNEQYHPNSNGFDAITVEAMGMYFAHEGYILSLEDEKGRLIWDARSCDMQQCTKVLNDITERMESIFSLNGALQNQSYPLTYNSQTIGTVTIETYGPFFYSETETQFLASINRLLLVASAVFILLSIVVSVLLSRTIARPILKAGEAAWQIALGYTSGSTHHTLGIRIPDTYKTRELAELSHSINKLAEELEEGERRQKRLTVDIAHELRTPLTCLQGTIEAMIDGVWKPDTERLVSCHEEVIRLTKLVEDLNTLTHLEWNDIDLNKTDFDLSKLLHLTVEQFMPLAQEKGIALKVKLRESPIIADYDRLKQVFINLLSNAIKYTDCGSVTVSIEKGEKNWAIRIADTGIGIPESDIPHVFERFYRSDKSRNHSTGGAGIGLTIAATIVGAHGGSISVESENGKGSVFTVQV